MRLVTLQEASKLTGISVTSLRRGIKIGRFPAIHSGVGEKRSKILMDVELLEQVLKQEAYASLRPRVHNGGFGSESEKEQQQPKSYLASLFRSPDDPVEAGLERDKLFGYAPRNTSTSGTISI